jgi:hypothetical protein
MKKTKFYIMILLLGSVVTLAQAQQSEFQGTWIGEGTDRATRLQEKLEISGNRWTFFTNNAAQAAGTARFSAGRAELLLANGNTYFDLTLLAPGLIEQPISMWAGLYRFRRVQSSTNPQNNPQSNTQNISAITIRNDTGFPGDAFWIKRTGNDDWGNRINIENGIIRNGQTSSVRLSSVINTGNRYDVALRDTDGDFYIKMNIQITLNGIITFTFDDFVSGN